MKQAIDILDEMINGCDFLIEQYIEDGDGDVTYPQNVRHYLRQAKSRIQALGDGWIPVTERLPEKEGEYITYIDLSFNKTIFHEHCIRQLDWDGFNFGDGEGYTHKITHWTYIKLPPNL